MLSRNRAVAYSLLAHVNDHSSGIADLADIFLPLIKRALCLLCRGGVGGALITDLKSEIDGAYHFDIPIPMLRMMLDRVQREVNASGEKRLAVYKDGTFSVDGFVFEGFEATVHDQEEAIEELGLAYIEFLRANARNVETEPSILEFLDLNRLELTGFFARGDIPNSPADFAIQAEFVRSVMGNKTVFQTLRRVFLGSIITSYLELDLEETGPTNIELVLDTNFVISLLGLHSEVSEQICRQVLEIAKRLGYQCTVLGITVDETKSLLGRIAEKLGRSFFIQSIDPESIEAACMRRGLRATDLQLRAAHLPDDLKEEFRIDVVGVTSELVSLVQSSQEYVDLSQRPFNPAGALHDAVLYRYVRDRRGERARKLSEVNCWFVADSRYGRNVSRPHRYFVGERILAEHLVSILWLSNPRVLSQDIGASGLTKLVAATLQESLPSAAVLRELDENVQKHAIGKVTDEDLIAVAHSSACKTAVNLRRLNESANESPDALCEELRRMAQEEKDRTRAEEQEQEARTQSLERRLANEIQKKERSQAEEEGLEESVKSLETQLASATRKAETAGLAARKEVRRELRRQLKEIEKAVDSLSGVRETLRRRARRTTNVALCGAIVVLFAPLVGCFVAIPFVGWDRAEWVLALLSWIPPVASALTVAITKRSLSPRGIFDRFVARSTERAFARHAFDEETFLALQGRTGKIQERLSELVPPSSEGEASES